jgi:CheY-like chemotaxis protein
MDSRGLSVVLVDDEATHAERVEAVLGASVASCTTATELGEVAASDGLLVVARVDPPLDAPLLAALRRLRAAGVPVLATSDVATGPTLRHLLMSELGVLDVLPRPVDPGALGAWVARQAAASPPPEPELIELGADDVVDLEIEASVGGHGDQAPAEESPAEAIEFDELSDHGALSLSRLEPGSVPDDGEIAAHAYGALLSSAALAGYTGSLLLGSETERLEFAFVEGRVVGSRSSRSDDRLGDLLVGAGRAAREVVEEAARIAASAGDPIGAVLLHWGIVTPEELDAWIAFQLRARLESAFAWTSGRFGFRDLPWDARCVGVAPEVIEAVWSGVEHRIDAGELDAIRGLPESSVVVRRAGTGRVPVEWMTSSQAHWFAALEMAGEAGLWVGAMVREEPIARLIYVLAVTGHAELRLP